MCIRDRVHHLVAYWDEKYGVSTYRYTHCYEVPDLDITSKGIETISLYKESRNLKDTLYLVPKDNEVFTMYGFTDLLTVKYNDNTKKVEYSEYGEDNGGGYYAVRGYETKDTEGKSVIKYLSLIHIFTHIVKVRNSILIMPADPLCAQG